METTPGACLRTHSRTGAPVPGRAHRGHRSRGAAGPLGPPLRALGTRGDTVRDHALHGRGRAVHPRRVHVPVALARRRQTRRAQGPPGGHPARHTAAGAHDRACGDASDPSQNRTGRPRRHALRRARAPPRRRGSGARRARRPRGRGPDHRGRRESGGCVRHPLPRRGGRAHLTPAVAITGRGRAGAPTRYPCGIGHPWSVGDAAQRVLAHPAGARDALFHVRHPDPSDPHLRLRDPDRDREHPDDRLRPRRTAAEPRAAGRVGRHRYLRDRRTGDRPDDVPARPLVGSGEGRRAFPARLLRAPDRGRAGQRSGPSRRE